MKPIYEYKKTLKVLKWMFLILVLFFTYFPLIVMALLSFSRDRMGTELIGFTFEWYGNLFEKGNLRDSIVFTFEITILSTVISTVLGTLSAIGINALSRKNKRRMIMFNNVPILNADIVTGVLLLLIFQITSLIIGTKILGFGTVLIAHILFSTPYVVLSVLPKLNEMDDNVFNAALDLGCTPLGALRKVIIPFIKSGVLSGALLAFTMSLDDFVISYFVAGKESNFSIWLYSSVKNMKNGQWPMACAYNTLIMVITIIGIGIYAFVNFQRNKEKKGEER